MGFLFSKIVELFSRSKNNFKILILGIQNAGKTTILYRLSIGQLVKTTPTIGSNVEEISYNNIKFQAWDLGGQESMRTMWDIYYMNTDGIIYVIDSNDIDNLEESKNQFYKLLQNDTLKNAVILIFANKQDIMTSKKVSELISLYDLDSIKDHIWHIQPCSAETGEGLLNGLKWLSNQLVDKNNNKFPNNPYANSSDINDSKRRLSDPSMKTGSVADSTIEPVKISSGNIRLNNKIPVDRNNIEISEGNEGKTRNVLETGHSGLSSATSANLNSGPNVDKKDDK